MTEDTMFGRVKFKMYHPDESGYRKFSLDDLKSNEFFELDFGWGVPDPKKSLCR